LPGYLNFKEVAEAIDVEQVASHLSLTLKRGGKDLRTKCPACKTEDERSLAIMPETNSFRCYAAGISGDCIALYAHVLGTGMYKAAKALTEQFQGTVRTVPDRDTAPSAPPQKPGVSAPASSAAPPPKSGAGSFDPTAFAAKLIYSDEVEALGISEEDAERLQIGYHPQRKLVYVPVRNPDGSISGFIGIKDASAVKMPPQWIGSNVVKLRRA
jgi:hypothetical protein